MIEGIDKIKLIYEYNNNSPLFARVAEGELQNNNITEAIAILENGLKRYPDYITAYLVYAEAYARLRKIDKVIEIMEKVKELMNDEKSVNYYLENFEEMRSIDETADKRDDDSLDKLAANISKAKIPKIDDSNQIKTFEENSNKSIVSETLAGIYYSQNSYEEALEMYEKLLKSNPAKSDFYREKIEELKNLMGN